MSLESAESRRLDQDLSMSPELLETLLDSRLPFDVDWRRPALDMDESSRLLRLARVKALLPPGNAIDEKTTHDATLENYIRLALDAAGDLTTLSSFLDHAQAAMLSERDGVEALAQQVFWIWAPAAEIAGLYQHKLALEEAAFKAMLPDEYEQTRQSYDTAVLKGERGLLIQTSDQIQTLLNASLGESVTHYLTARPKSNYSVWRKLRQEHRQQAELFDLLGFRIVINGDEELATQQCHAAMVAIAGKFESDSERFKDYIREPKATGYQSLHATFYTAAGFPFELQVRTKRMHEFAESDAALSHQGYDATFKETPGKIKQRFRKVPRLYRWRNEATTLIREQAGQTEGILGDDILFFRQDGNLYRLPADGNALDASFRIHSHRALRTKQIRRGGKPVRFSSPIHHGDVLDISYQSTYPSDMAHFDNYTLLVRTSEARRAVEKGRRQAMGDYYRTLGRNMVLAMVGNVGIDDPFALLDEADRRKLADRVGVPSFDSLLEIIGAGEASGKPGRVANWILARCGMGQEVVIKPVPEKLATLDNEEVLRNLVIPSLKGNPDCQVAGCCSEKIHRGDDVLARPSRIDGIFKVHLSDCNNVRTQVGTISCSWM